MKKTNSVEITLGSPCGPSGYVFTDPNMEKSLIAKKKIGDVTLKEAKEICKEHKCVGCPLAEVLRFCEFGNVDDYVLEEELD